MDRALILATVLACDWNVTAAAARLRLNPTTLAYRMKVAGVERPKVAARLESHAPAAALTIELEQLRARARAVVRAYLPGPLRTVYLRELEVEQRAILTKLRGTLGDAAPSGSRLPVAVRGKWQPDL